jgi:hypothetical protein
MSRPTLLLAIAACAFATGCKTSVSPVDDGAVENDADMHADSDADADADRDGPAADADGPAADADVDLPCSENQPGPMTFVVSHVVPLADRIADIDGDGDLDNCLADLREPGATSMVMAMSALVDAALDQGFRVLFHFPWVEDLSGPTDSETIVIVFEGTDPDMPEEPTDDFSGEELFFAKAESLDACGEPVMHSADATIDRGRLEGLVGTVVLPIGASVLVVREARAIGSFAACGESMDLTLAGAALVRDLGGEVSPLGGSTLLEALLAGGQAIGVPSAPGLTPDLDLDGDGLERFELDGSGQLLRCLDGDGTEILGRDCYEDERIADALSMTARVVGVPARFVGRDPGWEEGVAGTCEAPPEISLWDPR